MKAAAYAEGKAAAEAAASTRPVPVQWALSVIKEHGPNDEDMTFRVELLPYHVPLGVWTLAQMREAREQLARIYFERQTWGVFLPELVRPAQEVQIPGMSEMVLAAIKDESEELNDGE